MNFDQVVVIIDDFSYRSLSNDNVYYYDAGYLDTLRLYGYELYSDDVLTIEEGNSEYLIKDSIGSYYLVNPNDFVSSNQSDSSIKAIDGGTYINNGVESYYTDFLEFNADNASDENIPLHGDWVYEAFINQLDNHTTDIILIDVDALYSDTLNNHINELFSIVENPHTQSNTTQLQLIVEGWIDNHNTDNKEYSFSVLSYSISGSTPSENQLHALDWMEEQYVMMVQAAPNNDQAGTTWASLYTNVINVGAWNVDNNDNALFSNSQSYGLIDIFSDGYIVKPGWGEAFGTSFSTPKVAAELTNEIEILISDLNSKLDSGEMTEQELRDSESLPYSEIVNFMQHQVTDQVIVDYKSSISYWPINVLTDDIKTLSNPAKVSELNNGNYFYKVEDVYLITDFVIHEDNTQTRTYIDQDNIQWISLYKLTDTLYNETLTNSAGEVIIKNIDWYEDGSSISSKAITYTNNINHLVHKLWQWDSAQELEIITHTNTVTQQVSINKNKYDSVNNLIHSIDATSITREGVMFHYDTSLRLADDSLVGTLTYNSIATQFNNLPDWLIIDTNTGILSGIPQANDLGNYEISISVIDDSGYQVSDIFTLTVVDSATQSGLSNNIPVAINDTKTTNEDTPVNINVLSNDIDIDGDTLSVIFATADNGIVVINADSTLTYIASQNFNGIDTITYIVSDAAGGTSIGTVTIDVITVNDAPIISTSINSVFSIDADLLEVRAAETVTKMQASIDEYGADYTGGDTSKVMKFEMWVNAAQLDAFGTGATEIRGYQFDMDWDATNEVQPLNWSVTTGNYIGTTNTDITLNAETGSVAVASSTAIVDTIATNDGPPTFTGSDSLIATFYINPVADLEVVNLSVKDILIVTESGNIEPRDFTSAMELSSVNATVQTDSNNYLDGLSLSYFKDGADTGVSTLVENGNISFDQVLEFDSVKLSEASAYNSGVQADDAVAVLRHIVALDSLDGNATGWNAADVNNNGAIQADDAVAILRDIVALDDIDDFDLVDNVTGNRITTLDPAAAEGDWTIVANGDVNGSGSYEDVNTVAVDIA